MDHGIARPALRQDSVAALELRLWVNLLHGPVLGPYDYHPKIQYLLKRLDGWGETPI